MSTKGDRDATVERLLRTSLRGGSAGTGATCPPPDLLAAFVEGALAQVEREAAEAHLAGCERCQDALAALSRMPVPTPAKAHARPHWGWLRWLAPAAAVLTVLILYVALKPRLGYAPTLKTEEELTRLEQAVQQARPNLERQSEPARLAAPTQPLARDAGVKADAKPKQERRIDALQPLPVPPPARLVGQNALVPPAAGGAAPSPPGEAAARGVPAAAPPLVAAESVETKGAPPVAKPQAADAATKPAPQMAGAGAGAPVGGATFRAATGGVPMAKTVAAPAAADAKEPRAGVVAESLADGAPRPAPIVFASKDGSALWRIEFAGVVSRSTDRGLTWRPAERVAEALTTGSAPTGTTAWVVGPNAAVWRTTDGQHWTRCSFPERVDLVGVDAKDERTATVVTRDGRRFATSDGGVTWTAAR